MHRTLATLVVFIAFAFTAATTYAANAHQCRHPVTGKFIKCPQTAANAHQCRHPVTGKFIKCP